MINRTFFFNAVRTPIFGGSISQSQVDGLNAILDFWQQSGLEDDRWLSYAIATAYHETAATLQPINERGGADYFNGRYGPQTKVGRSLGNTQPGDGARFAGRGYVQLTGRANYDKAGKKLGFDLVNNPNLALDPTIAAKIMFAGMSEGWFTGKRFSHYFTETLTDWVNARRIINSTDRAELIAGYAQKFHAAISHKG